MADVILPQFKICTGCKQGKPFSEYGKHKQGMHGLRSRCRSCRAVEALTARLADPEKHKEWSLKWYYANKDHVAARSSAWQKDNKERVNAKSKRWRNKNLNKIIAYNRIYKSENKAEIAIQARNWRLGNMEASRCIRRNRKARIRNSAGKHSASETAHLLAKQIYRCANCECDLTINRKHLDHWQPVALGGSNSIENLQWLCQPCNQTKTHFDPIEWLRRIGKASHWPKQN